MIRPATPADAAAIVAIYNPYVTTTTISFEEAPVSAAEMAQRIETVVAKLPWYVFEIEGQVVGYAYATPWRVRPAYRHRSRLRCTYRNNIPERELVRNCI
jgi:L-amino acid N-acyltransferase YncA